MGRKPQAYGVRVLFDRQYFLFLSGAEPITQRRQARLSISPGEPMEVSLFLSRNRFLTTLQTSLMLEAIMLHEFSGWFVSVF